METTFFAQLSAIRARRGERDEWLLSQILIPVAKNLKESFFRWVDGELTDLRREIELLDTIAIATARERINHFRNELSTIERETLKEALERLQQLIDYIEKEIEKTPKEVIEKFRSNVELALEITSRLIFIRQTLDSMADMIPQPSIESE
jgi:vacuolar-type H+-ATPase subunit H